MKLHLKMAAITATAIALTATGLGSQPKSKPETKHIEIVASRFSFAPNEITVKKGEQVTLSVKSTDVTHGLVIEELGVRTTQIKKGQPEDIVTAQKNWADYKKRPEVFCE